MSPWLPANAAYLAPELAADLATRVGRADVIHANNVLAHVPDFDGVMDGIRLLLKDDGVAIVEVPSLRDMIEHVEFDTIYHEHLCYFSLTAIHRLAGRHGLTVVDVEHISIHGGTLRVSLQASGPAARMSAAVDRMLAEELALGMDAPSGKGRGSENRRSVTLDTPLMFPSMRRPVVKPPVISSPSNTLPPERAPQ